MDIYKKNSIEELLCYCALIMLFATKAMGELGVSDILKLIMAVACLMLAIKLTFMKWTGKELVIAIYLNLLGILIWIFSGRYNILVTILVITSLKDIEIERALKICFWSITSFFAIHMILILLGILDSELSYSLDEGIRKRYGLGYLHPNPAHSVVVVIIFLGLLAYKEKLKTCHYILLALFNFIIYYFTDSRTGMLLALLGIIGAYILYLARKLRLNKYVDVVMRNKVIKFFISNTFIIMTAFSFIGCFLYSKYGILGNIGTVSARFMTASRVIENDSITLFGQRDITTDLGYIYIFYRYGVVLWGVWLAAYSMLLRKVIQNKLYVECVLILCFAMYSMIENFTGSILINVTLIFMSFIVYPNNLKKYQEGVIEEKVMK